MGFKDFFERRKKHERQSISRPGTSLPVETSSTTSQTSVPQAAPQAAAESPSNTKLAVNVPHISRDLWDEAYEFLRAEKPDLIAKYMEIILEHGNENTKSSDQELAPPRSFKREEQLRRIVITKINGVDLAKWKIKVGNHSIAVRDQFDKAVKIVIATKDFISSAISSEPHAGLAWAGVCLFLPLLENPMHQDQDVHDCLATVPFVVRRLRVMERLIRPSSASDYQHENSLLLVKDYEDTAIELYRTILEFQIRVCGQYSDRWIMRYGRDVFKAGVWADFKAQISRLESRCTNIARDLSFEMIETGLQSSELHIQQGFEQVQKDLERTAAAIEHQTMVQTSWRQTDEEREVVQLFRKGNPYENQKNRTPKRVPGTCNWVFDNPKFLNWEQSKLPDLLWLSAQPGSGKSVVVKTLVDERLKSIAQSGFATCYFFFKDVSAYQRSPASALAAILHQLFSAIPSLVRHALNGKELPSLLEVMFDILVDAATDPAVTQIVCVIDALDECDDNERVHLIEKITTFYREARDSPEQPAKLKFFLTSRPYDDIQYQFHAVSQEVPTIHLSGDEESAGISSEIDQVTITKVRQIAGEKGYDQDTTSFLEQKLLEVKNRTYLWLSLILEEIRLSRRRGNRKEMERLVSELPRSVMDAYDSILNKSRDKKLARDLLHVIIAAKTPLSLVEMSVATALAEDLSYKSYEEIGLESPNSFGLRIRNICGLFVIIDNGYVYLIHQTAKEYLVEKENDTKGDWRHAFRPHDSETLIAKVCVSFLLFDCFSKDPLPEENNYTSARSASGNQGNLKIQKEHESDSYLESHPFLKYAALNWVEHCRSCELESQETWLPGIALLCNTSSVTFKRWYSIYRHYDNEHLHFPDKTTNLNVAAQFVFPNVLRHFVKQGDDPNEQDGHGATPLQRAAGSSLRATKILVEAGADVNAAGWENPWVTELDQYGDEIQVRRFSGPPLLMAVLVGEAKIAEYLINHGADANLKIGQPVMTRGRVWTLLHLAVAYGRNDIIEILASRKGVNVNEQAVTDEEMGASDDLEGFRIYHSEWPNAGNNENNDEHHVVGNSNGDAKASSLDGKLNLDEEEDDDDDEVDGLTPLHLAIGANKIEAVKLLLKYGADVHVKDVRGESPMDLAKYTGHKEILELLQAFDTKELRQGTS